VSRRHVSVAAGFTLLELIVVVGVFSVMAAMAYGGLSTVLNSRAHIEQVMNRNEQFQKAYLVLRQDLQNASSRIIRDGNGNAQPAFSYDGLLHQVELTRTGYANPLGLPRTTFQRLSYRIVDHKLIRSTWRVLDRAPRSEPTDSVLLDNVDQMQWRFLDAQMHWQTTWPISLTGAKVAVTALTASNPLASLPPPVAVDLRLRTKDWGLLRFVFQTGIDAQQATTGTPTTAGSGPLDSNASDSTTSPASSTSSREDDDDDRDDDSNKDAPPDGTPPPS
jgi:general secretion pathway protein J